MNRKTHWLRTTLLVLIACGIAGVALAAVLFLGQKTPTYAYSTVQFAFDGAADGVAPNGHRFSADEIKGDEMLAAAVEGTSYTADQIRDSLRIEGNYPEEMASQVMNYESLMSFTTSRELTLNDYRPTVYTVTLTNEFDPGVGEGQLKEMLGKLLAAWKTRFTGMSSLRMDDSMDPSKLVNYDYPQQLLITSEMLYQAAGFADELAKQEPSFRVGGAGFADLAVRMRSLVDTEVTKIEANITMNALSRDMLRLLTQYQYQVRQLNYQLTHQKQRLERMDQLVSMYEKNEIIYLSTAESLTKIDGNSSETYDALISARKEIADQITGIQSQINTYQLRIADLTKKETADTAASAAGTEAPAAETEGAEGENAETAEGEGTAVVEMMAEESEAAAKAAEEAAQVMIARLEEDISRLLTQRSAVLADFSAMLDAYNQQKLNEGTLLVSDAKAESPSLISGAFIVKAIKTAGPLCAVGFMVCLVLIIISRKKEEKA